MLAAKVPPVAADGVIVDVLPTALVGARAPNPYVNVTLPIVSEFSKPVAVNVVDPVEPVSVVPKVLLSGNGKFIASHDGEFALNYTLFKCLKALFLISIAATTCI